MKVEISEQVEAYIRGLPPEPRRKLRMAVRKLATLSGDIKQLEGHLSKFKRLRVGPHRIVFCMKPGKQGPVIQCVYAQHRSVIYTVLERMFET